MKVENISSGVLYLHDLKLTRQSQTEARRSEDVYLGPGRSVYLPDTSEVIRSAHSGDLKGLQTVGKVKLNDMVTLAAFPGPGNKIVLKHNLGYIPFVAVYKMVTVGAETGWVDAAGTYDLWHDFDFTSVSILNTIDTDLNLQIRIG